MLSVLNDDNKNLAADKSPTVNIDLNLFFNASQDLFCIAGFDGYFKKVNPAVIQTLGYTEAELLSRPINDFVHPEDRQITEEKRIQLRQEKVVGNFENRYVSKNGDVVWLCWTSVPNHECQLIFAVAKNITTKKSEESEREQTINYLSSYQQELKDLVYTALHDLRSPLGNLISIFEVYDELKSPPSPYSESLGILRSCIGELKTKMDEYFDRLIKANGKTKSLEEISLSESLRRVNSSLAILLKETKAIVNEDFSAVDTVLFDPAYLDSIFLNLISNSIKYARPNVAPVISIISQDKPDFIKIVFKDNGLGFDQSKVGDRIFNFQQRFHSDIEGKGVGLYLVKKHLVQFGGNISVDSQPNKGSTFTVNIKKR